MTERFANDASTSLTEAVNAAVTKVKVASATGFPSSAQFRIRIDAEIMLVTAGAGTTEWTVERAVEPVAGVQTAAAHGGGAKVKHVLTAGALGAFDTAGSPSYLQPIATVSAAATLAVNKLTPVNAEAKALTMTLPTGQAVGTVLACQKVDSSTNEVTVEGSIRGVGGSKIGLKLLNETLALIADSAGSWWPVSSHKTLSSLEALFAATTGEGAPAKGLALGRFYIQKEGAKSIALWRGKGVGEEPEQVADLTGTPADGSVTTAKIAAGAVTAAGLASGAVEPAALATSAVTTAKIAAGAVTESKLAALAVATGKIAEAAITAAKLAAGAVGSAALAVGAVTAEKLATGAVTAVKIAAEAVETAAIKLEAITTGLIANLAVTTAKLAEGAVTAAKLGAEAVETAAIKALAVTTAKIAEGAVTAAKLGAEAVEEAKIKAEAVTAGKIATNAVTTAKIAAGNITESKLAESAVAEAKLATAVKNKLLTLEAAGALTERAETTEFEVNASKAAIVNLQLEGPTLTRTKIKILVGGVVVAEPAISATSAGVTVNPTAFAVPAGGKWKWEKIEGTPTVKTSYTVL